MYTHIFIYTYIYTYINIYTHIYIYIIWVNLNISLTWIQAILGWFLLLTMIHVRSQWGRYNLTRFEDLYIYTFLYIPVALHKVVAEVSKLLLGELLWCMDGRANPLMGVIKVVEANFRVTYKCPQGAFRNDGNHTGSQNSWEVDTASYGNRWPWLTMVRVRECVSLV